MKLRTILSVSSALCLGAVALPAQETDQLQQLQRQLRQLQETFEKTIQQQRQQIEALQKQIDALQPRAPGAAPAATPPAPPTAVPAASSTPAAPPVPKPPWSPAAPIQVLGGQRAYLNLSFDALFAAGGSTADDLDQLQFGGHDPNQRGFTVQNLETVFEGKVDPYFRGQASLVGHTDASGDFHFEAEEAYAETLALPQGLQLKAGQFLTEFGRMNPTHPHTWNFADAPLVTARFLGPEGLRNPGARLSWLTPTPFYSELFLAVQDSQGETAYSFRGGGGHSHEEEGHELFFGRERVERDTETLGDLLFAPRYAVSFDLSDSQTLLLGTSAAFGPNNSGEDTCTQIYGVDLFWKWKPADHHGGFPFVSWQTEALLRCYQADAYSNDANGNGILDPDEEDVFGDGSVRNLAGETLADWGLYSEVACGFRKGWVAALRGDYVTPQKLGQYELDYGPDLDRATRWRIAPNLTWYPSEFSKIRLQYNYDYRDHLGPDHSVWLQLEFLLGSHAAHKF